MIERLFNSLTQLTDKVRTVHQTAYVLSAFTLVSIVLALVRDRLFAHTFGAGTTLDVYNAAFRIPDLLFIVLGSFVSVFVIIPALTEAKEEGRDHALARTLFATTGVLYVIASGLVYIFLPTILTQLFPDLYSRGVGGELEMLTTILLLQPFLLGLSNLAASCVQMYGRYTLFALAPILYNMGIIFGALVLYPSMGVAGLGWGVVVGALLHFGVQAPFFFLHGLSFEIKDTLPALRTRGNAAVFVHMREMWRIMYTSLPRTLSLSFGAIAFLVLLSYASTLPAGSIALFIFAFNLQAAPLMLIGASYSVAAFPTLSRLYRENNHEEFVSHMLAAGRHILFWSLPLTAICIVLRAHIVRAVLGTGLFTWSDTRIAAATFALFILSLAAQGITLLFIRGYYAAGKTLVPLIVTFMSALLSVVASIGLVYAYTQGDMLAYFLHDLLRLAPYDNASIALIALGISAASILSALLLVLIFALSFPGVGSEMGKALRDGFVGAVFAGTGTYVALLAFAQVYGLTSLIEILTQGFVAGLAGCVTGSLVLYLIGNREIREVYASLHGNISKLSRIRVKGVEAHGE